MLDFHSLCTCKLVPRRGNGANFNAYIIFAPRECRAKWYLAFYFLYLLGGGGIKLFSSLIVMRETADLHQRSIDIVDISASLVLKKNSVNVGIVRLIIYMPSDIVFDLPIDALHQTARKSKLWNSSLGNFCPEMYSFYIYNQTSS